MIKFYCSELAATWKLLLILRALRLKFASFFFLLFVTQFDTRFYFGHKTANETKQSRDWASNDFVNAFRSGWWRWTSTESDDHDERWWLLVWSLPTTCVLYLALFFFCISLHRCSALFACSRTLLLSSFAPSQFASGGFFFSSSSSLMKKMRNLHDMQDI